METFVLILIGFLTLISTAYITWVVLDYVEHRMLVYYQIQYRLRRLEKDDY